MHKNVSQNCNPLWNKSQQQNYCMFLYLQGKSWNVTNEKLTDFRTLEMQLPKIFWDNSQDAY